MLEHFYLELLSNPDCLISLQLHFIHEKQKPQALVLSYAQAI